MIFKRLQLNIDLQQDITVHESVRKQTYFQHHMLSYMNLLLGRWVQLDPKSQQIQGLPKKEEKHAHQ